MSTAASRLGVAELKIACAPHRFDVQKASTNPKNPRIKLEVSPASRGGISMERIITELVQDFEQGKMTRRQLIRSLTVAASAAAGLSGAPAATAAPPDGYVARVVSLNHVSYQVSDYKKCR